MKWSWRIGRLFGIGIFVHATFPILLLWVALLYYQQGETVAAAVGGVLFTISVFAIVVMHELGHALTARRFGIETRDIILLPIGGVARLERLPTDPRQELLIAVAGPAVNVVLALLILGVLTAAGMRASIAAFGSPEGSYLNNLLWVNIYLVLFNALPAFPMDGGRVLRALLAMRMNHARATEVAAAVGKAFAFIFVMIGLFAGPWTLIVIGLFVWMGASGEASMARIRYDLGGARLADVMITDVSTLAPGDPLERGIEQVLAGFQPDFPVVENGALVGLLTREDLLKALASEGRAGMVGDAMRKAIPIVAPDEAIDQVFTKLQAAGLRTLPVVSEGVLIGVVTTENVAEYLMFRTALKNESRAAGSVRD